MPVSLETQEIMIAFAIDNKDNYASWGKYELDELQFAYDEMPEADRASTTGQRIKERIDELASGKDHLQDIKQEESPEHPLDDNEQEQATEQPSEHTSEQPAGEAKPETPYIIGAVIIVVIVLALALYFI